MFSQIFIDDFSKSNSSKRSFFKRGSSSGSRIGRLSIKYKTFSANRKISKAGDLKSLGPASDGCIDSLVK